MTTNNTFCNQKREENNTFRKTNVANNVAQRISQDDELMKKIFPHKEVINGKIVSVFPYIEEVYPLKDVPQEVVSKMEKTIDHISQEGKKVSLTEQWKKGELESGLFYVKMKNNDKPIVAEYDKETCFYTFRSVFRELNRGDIEEVLAPVPSYDEWRSLQSSWVDEMDRATRFKKALDDVCEEYNSKLPILEAENQRLKKVERKKGALVNENYKLKKLLKECGRQLEEVELCRYDVADVDQEDWFRISTEQAGIAKKMKTKIDEALK